MTQQTASIQGTDWVSLGVASRILNVNEATLRDWADRGMVRVFRTPGGHRRFHLHDLHALTERRGALNGVHSPHHDEDMVLRRMRRRLQQGYVAQQGWYSGLDEGSHARLRLFGRRLLSLLVRCASEGHVGRPVRDEARLLGVEYGQEMARQSISLKDTLEAFIFFRNNVAEFVDQAPGNQVASLADTVLLGIGEGYQGIPGRQVT